MRLLDTDFIRLLLGMPSPRIPRSLPPVPKGPRPLTLAQEDQERRARRKRERQDRARGRR